jgi:hypothetical protein
MYTDFVDNRLGSKYAHYALENNQHVFSAEIGTGFYLKLVLTANPSPTSCNLYKDGVLLPPATWNAPGTIYITDDSVDIQTVQFTDAGNYTITSSNSMGQGQFSFRLNVLGKILFLSNLE